MTYKINFISFAAGLTVFMTLIYGMGWCGPTLPMPPPEEVDIEYLEAMQRDLPENYVEVIQYILRTSDDPYVRERGVFALTDIALNKNQADTILNYLTGLAMSVGEDENIRTAAFANIHLIRDLRPQEKRGTLDLYISGELKKGGTVTLVARISSTVSTGEESVVGISSLHENIVLLSERPVEKRYLEAGRPQEIQFDLALNETGSYFIPVTFLLSVNSVDYEQIQKRIHFEVAEGADDCLDTENPNLADEDGDGDVDGFDLSAFAAEYAGSDQECYGVEWFAGIFGMISADSGPEPEMSEFEAARFMAVNPGLKALICPPGCECLTGPDAEAKFGYGSFYACSDKVCGYGWVGDLYMAKYCYSEIPIDECIDTDGGKVYDVKGSAPGCVDRCSEFSHPPTVVNECYVDVIDGQCQVNIAYYDCNSICEDGRCLPPTCDDWIQNQGEEGIDCGGPCEQACNCPSGCKCATGDEAENHFGAGAYVTCTSSACGRKLVGDIWVPTYCYKKIESSDCYDTDGGADIYEKGFAPGCEDTCISDQTLQECLAIQTIDGCTVYSSPWECEGRCQDGACMMPSCDDGIQNQDEVAVDCSVKSIYADCDSCCYNGIQDYDEEGVDCGGSQCIPCGYIEVRGRLLHEDWDGTTALFRPVRYGNLLLRLCGSHPCTSPTHQAEWTTDSVGNFVFWVPKMDFKSAFVRLGHTDDDDPYRFNYAVRIAKDLDDCHETVWWHSGSRQIPDTRIIDFGDLRIGRNANLEFTGYWQEETDAVTCGGGSDESGTLTGGSEYFNIADAILYARQYADGKRSDNDNIGYVDVQWPDASDTSFYNAMYEEITLETEDGFSDGTAVHEYGHYLQDAIGTNDDYWGDPSHDYCTDDKNEEFAWSEGFSEYFGTIVPWTYDALSNPNVDYGIIESPYCFEISREDCCGSPGVEAEATVSAVLWDLADPYSGGETFDTVSARETLIFNIFDDELDNGDSIAADAPHLCEFIEQGINCRVSGTDKDAMWLIFNHYNVNCSTSCDN